MEVTGDDITDYGNDDDDSVLSPSGADNYDSDNGDRTPEFTTDFDGIHSDLFEDFFGTVLSIPTSIVSQAQLIVISSALYCSQIESTFLRNHRLLPILFVPLQYRHLTFDQRAQKLYLHWNVFHKFTTLSDIREWLESLTIENHLL